MHMNKPITAIQDALLELSIEYTLPRFLDELVQTQDNTFKNFAIQHALEKS